MCQREKEKTEKRLRNSDWRRGKWGEGGDTETHRRGGGHFRKDDVVSNVNMAAESNES